MADRRKRFGEAALTVISTGGLRALTHRSVDEAAGLPPGSVNYYAPTRAKLEALALTEAYEQMYAIAIRTFGPILETDEPSTGLVLDCTTDFVAAMSAETGLVAARHALLVESQFDDGLRKQVTTNRNAFVAFTEPFVRSNAPDSPARTAELIVALVEGLIQQQTLVATTNFHRPMVRAAIARIFGFAGG
ncbi:TetR/AcrR family transcriptional regulator [Gordonia sp. SL306]|uniref:TetR/AcrR family transcriptional regulator n=1 Tax=Gordonia sp. SL306 TaxID=2995145 RepID=UPI0022703011|nr:hypothetical protein [Gordonia sp. SL306]WAC57188.1 hypothetical protein OVA31_08100 [Gordonia sp. SL306]